ncbi:MAG: hypothetical protein HYU46_24645, partial [Deltaproteobacteria bacterium]|nr:hypothetical protein [Deltaproteobacteria bacterium]
MSWPTDSHALLGLALALEEARHVRDATRAFGLLGTLACESGQLSLGILAARSLERCGTEAIGRELAGKLARSYSAGSPRIDPQVGMRPPVPPGHRQARGTSPKGELSPDLVLAKVDSALAKVDEATSSMASKEAKLPAIPFAQTLAAPVLERLISMIQVRLWRKDQVVVDTGDEARSMFWVADGRLRVSRGEHELGYL